jgi:hypothetical protein
MLQKVHTKRELYSLMKRFIKNKERGISTKLFCELAGISQTILLDTFVYHTEPLTKNVQRRVSKAYQAWLNGEVAIMQNRDRTKFVEYRREARPRIVPSTGLKMVNGQIKISVGMKNMDDYSQEPLLKGDNDGGIA